MRLFAAIALPDTARDRLEALQSGLPEKPRVPWENFHVTLAFFGEVDRLQAEDLEAGLSRIRFPPFTLSLDGVGAFGGDKPRHLYAAVERAPELISLQKSVETAARGTGIAVESRRYVPHVTLARMGGRRTDERLVAWMAGAGAFQYRPVEVCGFSLFSSSLGGGPPHYEELGTYSARANLSG